MSSLVTCIGIIFGGASQEHDVSIQSARTVINALTHEANASRFVVSPIYIDLQGSWWSSDIAKKALNKENHNLDLLENVKLFYKNNKEKELIEKSIVRLESKFQRKIVTYVRKLSLIHI